MPRKKVMVKEEGCATWHRGEDPRETIPRLFCSSPEEAVEYFLRLAIPPLLLFDYDGGAGSHLMLKPATVPSMPLITPQ